MKALFVSIALVAGITLFGAEPETAWNSLKSTLGGCREVAVQFYNSVH